MKRLSINQDTNRVENNRIDSFQSSGISFFSIKRSTYMPAFIVACIVIMFSFIACDNAFLDRPKPEASATDQTVYADTGAIQMVVNGLYSSWGTTIGGYGGSAGWVIRYLECFSDEMRQSGRPADSERADYIYADYDPSDLNTVQIFSAMWGDNYAVVNVANGLIERLPTATALMSQTTRNTFLGQAYFFRGQVYFEHALLFGDVPLVLTTDAAVSQTMARTPKATVLARALSDMEQAVALLPTVQPSNTIYYTSKYQAEAYLSYMYLAMGQWDKAEAAATDVINNGGFSLVTDLQAIFDTGSKEAILSVGESAKPITGYATYGNTLNLFGGYMFDMIVQYNYHLTDSLVNVYGSDPRLAKWYPVLGTFPKHQDVKYRYSLGQMYADEDGIAPISQTNIFMRLAEVYLIRAEARTQQGNTADAIADINVVRDRAGATPYDGSYSQAQAMQLVEKERLLELSCEGKRWLDLSRWGTTDQAMKNSSYKTGWASYKALLPIPQKQIELNPNLKPNNPGY